MQRVNKIMPSIAALALGAVLGAVVTVAVTEPTAAPPEASDKCATAAVQLDKLLESTAYELLVPVGESVYAGELVDPDFYTAVIAELATRQQHIDMTSLKECLPS